MPTKQQMTGERWSGQTSRASKLASSRHCPDGTISIMVWSAIAGRKKLKLVFMKKGTRTSADFINQVYEPVLLDFYRNLDSPVLMDDGALVHRAKIAVEWRGATGIKKMSWPAQSLDLNPIENCGA
ncbi:uncharacterized protein RHIMIDRAFT_242268 [Rhizopus microsporus ATCC 52813]|uniref:Tc1-like transposase DDE domain-containing protein n=1 Tax=Rhizopus microsporus ATCC 52813 TaxID=1340429 RepID=A0A2G4SG73_RHIZD|nr:uncharacterized protein RHIMIDRAFT_242268 [Rhizopus microsporus ATCC 52813]PHZ07760.1 hypothetical protein RHIMIDRAFT_242268 [Rhizopus microsporus ATCC 52813]